MAKLNDEIIDRRISMETLQDVDSSAYQSNSMAQFELHQNKLLVIAENGIHGENLQENTIWVLLKIYQLRKTTKNRVLSVLDS